MVHHTRLIILNTTKVGERSLVLHALSPDWGRRSFIASVPKGGGMALFQPLNILDAEVTENPKSDLWRVHALSPRHPLTGLRTSAGKNAMTLFMSEVLYRTIHESAREDGLFEWCERSILTLDALQGDRVYMKKEYLQEYGKFVENSVVYDEKFNILVCVMQDVTEREQAAQEKQELIEKTGYSRLPAER